METFVLLAVIVLLFSVLTCLPDPTRVCLPQQIQYDVFNLKTDEMSVMAIDFDRQLLGSTGINGKAVVQDFKNMKEYTIDKNGTCTYIVITQQNVFPRCLPANASLIQESRVGVGSGAIPIQIWEFYFGSIKVRYIVTAEADQPNFPVLLKFYGPVEASYSFTSNPSTTITQPNIFYIPDNCVPAQRAQNTEL